MFCVFYFIKISKFALPGVMLIYERTSKDRKKEGLVRPRGMFGMWLYLACKIRYGAGKHIWKLLVTSLST